MSRQQYDSLQSMFSFKKHAQHYTKDSLMSSMCEQFMMEYEYEYVAEIACSHCFLREQIAGRTYFHIFVVMTISI